MGSDIIQVAITTLASGGLAAIGSYIGIIWKLSSRVTKLEVAVTGLKEEQEELRGEQKELGGRISGIREKQDEVKKEIITSIGLLQRELQEFKIICSENRSAMVRKKEFNIFTDEQEKRWSEFYRLIGRLEGAMDRLSRRPPPLITNSSNT